MRAVRDLKVALDLHAIERRLRRAIGPSVPKRVSAALLGVSVTSIDDLVDRGLLPVVVRPGSSRARIATLPLLDLAAVVDDVRAEGVVRGVLARAIERLQWRGYGERIAIREDIARLPRSNVPAAELRREFLTSTDADRVLRCSSLSATASRIRIAGEELRHGA